MNVFRLSHLIIACSVLVHTGVSAATQFTAILTNVQENPPVTPTTTTGAPRPLSSGTATFLLNDPMTALTFSGTVNNIDFTGLQTADVNDNLTSAHIHASPSSVPGINAGVVFGFFGAPLNDNNPTDVVLTPFASGVGGNFSAKWDIPEGNNTTLLQQLPNLLAGRGYINFHTIQFAGGEIRGQILPVQGVPDAGSGALLFGLGFLGIMGVRKILNAATRPRGPHRE